MRLVRARPMVASLLAHGVVLTPLFLLRELPAQPEEPLISRHVTILAPHPDPPPRPRRRLVVRQQPQPRIVPARVFVPVRVTPGKRPVESRIEIPPVRSTEIATLAMPAAEAPRPLPPPPFKTDNFGDAAVVSPPPPPAIKPAPLPPPAPIEILSKPRPIYTEEARRLKIEGEVLLEVLFAASGEAHVQRVVRGLGHGLDEAAADAARQLRFRPAHRGPDAIDSVATVHIFFQLAY